MYIYICTYVYTHIHVCVCVCVYIYIYMYIQLTLEQHRSELCGSTHMQICFSSKHYSTAWVHGWLNSQMQRNPKYGG